MCLRLYICPCRVIPSCVYGVADHIGAQLLCRGKVAIRLSWRAGCPSGGRCGEYSSQEALGRLLGSENVHSVLKLVPSVFVGGVLCALQCPLSYFVFPGVMSGYGGEWLGSVLWRSSGRLTHAERSMLGSSVASSSSTTRMTLPASTRR